MLLCCNVSQSLFYWIIYSYKLPGLVIQDIDYCLNPYFIGLSTLIIERNYFNGLNDAVSILILLDYLLLFYLENFRDLFIDVSILILLDYLLLLFVIYEYYKDDIESQSLFYWIIYSYHK